MTAATDTARPQSTRLVHRYQIHELLGRGGMACVYRATDLANGREVAFKQLTSSPHARSQAGIQTLFEREYHTLAQLNHPRVIAVYDYGVEAGVGAYYTMELLDGGDLYERAPLHWQEACVFAFDICSSLALLHSRRLIHRDISPRNIRCTRDGRAKLIDFGAMAPMGPSGSQIVGTPAFTPPEAVHRMALDGRSDLFSLGVTLYFTLTRTLPYPVRSFSELVAAFRNKPVPPSAHVRSIPAALDDLVMALINPEPGLRPRLAFEVMQRLSAVSGFESDESEEVPQAYLSTPTLVGRQHQLEVLRKQVRRACAGTGTATLITGGSGSGRSRMLDAAAREAKTLGAIVLRTQATGGQTRMGAASALAAQLLDLFPQWNLEQAHPDLFERMYASAGAIDPGEGAQPANDVVATRTRLRDLAHAPDAERVQESLCHLWLSVSHLQPLSIAIDDVHRIDRESAAVLAQVIDRARLARVCVVLTADPNEADSQLVMDALARRCETLPLTPLDEAQTKELLGSLFGEVANLDRCVSEIHKVARGNPGQCMAIAEHLVERKVIKYNVGNWVLPAVLNSTDLPRSAQHAVAAQIAALPALARWLAEAQALAFYNTFTLEEYRALRPDLGAGQIERALNDLLAVQALVSDGHTYTLANRVWRHALRQGLTPQAAKQTHSALADMYRAASSLAQVHHLFEAERDEEGLDALLSRHREYEEDFDYKTLLEQHVSKLAPSYIRALEYATAQGHSQRVINDLRRWFTAASVTSEPEHYWQAAPAWFERLAHDSGLALWREDTTTPDPGMRLMNALQRAQERYQATPEAERVYPVDEAIRLLAEYVVFSIAIGARTMDYDLLTSLPPVLEPFVPLSPLLEAIWQNATATRDSNTLGHDELARARWLSVLDKLDAAGGEMQHVEAIRNAVSFAIGMMEAHLGLASAAEWGARVEQDPMQRVGALQLRKIARLMQGDWNGADALRREAELHALRSPVQPMFQWLLTVELCAYAQARDLAGLTQVTEQLRPWAARCEGWVPYMHEAEARFHAVRGDLGAAKSAFEHCLALCHPERTDGIRSTAVWLSAHAGLAEVLLELGDARGAAQCVQEVLPTCEEQRLRGHGFELSRVLALAEAKQGDYTQANARLDRVIAEQKALGISGLRLGLSYEARAQVAIWNLHEPDFERYARLTAQEYRYAAGCPLGARYERLVNDATRRGLRPAPALSEYTPTELSDTRTDDTRDIYSVVLRAFASAGASQRRRAERALRLLRRRLGASSGHLCLTTPAGLHWVATQGEAAPPQGLLAYAHDTLAEVEPAAESALLTGTLLYEPAPKNNQIELEGRLYWLLPLTCIRDAELKQVGAVALRGSQAQIAVLNQSLLLTTVAAQFLEAGDSCGALGE